MEESSSQSVKTAQSQNRALGSVFLRQNSCLDSKTQKKAHVFRTSLHREVKGKDQLWNDYAEAAGNMALRAAHSCVCLYTQELKLEFCFRNVLFICVCVDVCV